MKDAEQAIYDKAMEISGRMQDRNDVMRAMPDLFLVSQRVLDELEGVENGDRWPATSLLLRPMLWDAIGAPCDIRAMTFQGNFDVTHTNPDTSDPSLEDGEIPEYDMNIVGEETIVLEDHTFDDSLFG